MKRVRLTWNRNSDNNTKYYRIYRSEYPSIDTYNRDEFLVMRIKHVTTINPVKIENERAERISARTYVLTHHNILLDLGNDTFPFVVTIDEEPITTFMLDTEIGRIVFDDEIPQEAVVKVVEYTFDGLEAWDYGIDELFKSYYGPDAKDISAPSAPTGVRMTPDYDGNRILIEWEGSVAEGKQLYYRIDSIEESSSYSQLSQWETVVLKEDLADVPYLIEKSLDGLQWRQIARVKQNRVYEYLINRRPPNAVKDLTCTFSLLNVQGRAKVAMNWRKIVDDNPTATAMYRIRAVNKVGAISPPSSIVGPIPFSVRLKEIIIRRKISDGTLPTLDGFDAVTVATLSPSSTKYEEEVNDNTEYTYGIYVIDLVGNQSELSYFNIHVKDNSAPNPVLIFSATEFSLGVG